MNVRELREALDGLDDDTEVRYMEQPSWPFEYSIVGTWVPSTEADEPDACGECGLTRWHHEDPSRYAASPEDVHDFEPYESDRFVPSGLAPSEKAVYLVEGTQLGYGTKTAWEEVERW